MEDIPLVKHNRTEVIIIRKDAKINRDKILNAAKSLFKRKDIEDINVTEIAKQAQIGVGTLYRNYPSKSALCLGIAIQNIQQFVDKNHEYLKDTNNDPNQIFYKVIHSYLEFKDQNAQLLNNVDSDFKQGLKFYRSHLYQNLAELFQRIIRLQDNESKDSFIQFKADMLIATLKSQEYVFQTEDRKLTKDELINNLNRLLN